ncbi:MAG TPA: DUF488 family protein [Thermoanaerobaculia bacterium]|nr:DUF488 family protein [Thermoanaerobaculia bacterium]
MAIRVVRLGTPRVAGEGLRLGTVRRPPRGVRKEDFARRDFYDVWLPDLAPSAELVHFAVSEPFTPARWADFAKRYRREMGQPAAERLLTLLAALSRQTNFSLGCYCENPDRCHRSLLRDLLIESRAEVADAG